MNEVDIGNLALALAKLRELEPSIQDWEKTRREGVFKDIDLLERVLILYIKEQKYKTSIAVPKNLVIEHEHKPEQTFMEILKKKLT